METNGQTYLSPNNNGKESTNQLDYYECEVSLSGYLKIPAEDLKNRVLWLKENGKNVYEEILFHFAFYEHILPSGSYQTIVNRLGYHTPLSMKWESIKEILGNHFYDKYVSFEHTSNDGLELVLVDEFDAENRTCYSIPLFRSIIAKLGTEKEVTFEFSKVDNGKQKNSPYVIFKVSGTSLLGEFDMNYSTKPLLIDVKNPM